MSVRFIPQGPDAREKREGMGSMHGGWSVDHATPAGRLATLFSAPDYPQFVAEGEARYNNAAAVAVLTGPQYDEPQILTFLAAPRPHAVPYYDLGAGGSDEEGPDGDLAAATAAAAAVVEASVAAAPPLTAPAEDERAAGADAAAAAADAPAVATPSEAVGEPPSQAAVDASNNAA